MCLNPLLCLLIKRRAGVKTHYFLHASPLSGSSSPGDLENVCSPKRTPHPPAPHPHPAALWALPWETRAHTGHKHGHADDEAIAGHTKYSGELQYTITKDKSDTNNKKIKKFDYTFRIKSQSKMHFVSVFGK